MLCMEEPGTPNTRISRWWIGECPSEMRGRMEIKYLSQTKRAWLSRRLVQLLKETLAWDTYRQNGRTTVIIKPQPWVNSPTALWVPWEM